MNAKTSQSEPRGYVPGFGLDVLLPLYDPMHRLIGLGRVHAAMVDAADLQPAHDVLDVGCGTGNLLLQLADRRPDTRLTGVDPDPRAIARARRKARRAGVAVRFEQGFAQQLPAADETVDRVFSSLMFHHLDPPTKEAMLAEVRRVLRPGGVLVLADFDGESDDGHGHGHGLFGRRAARARRLRDNAGLRRRIAAAGFGLGPAASYDLRLGRIEIVRATRER